MMMMNVFMSVCTRLVCCLLFTV